MARFEREQSEYIEKVVATNRVSKTVKGGRVRYVLSENAIVTLILSSLIRAIWMSKIYHCTISF